MREPVWKSSCGLCHSPTIFRVEGADSAVFVLAGGAPTQTQFKLLQWFIWTVLQHCGAARTSVWTGRVCSPSIMSRASAGGRGRASLECTGWGIRGGRSAPCWPPPRSGFPRAGLYPEGSPLCYCWSASGRGSTCERLKSHPLLAELKITETSKDKKPLNQYFQF